jgi:hypothetical protein
LIDELIKIIDEVNINELGMRAKLEAEVERFNKFQGIVLKKAGQEKPNEADVNIRTYAKYLLKEGSIVEKRELLGNLRSRIVYKDKTLTLLAE